MTKKTPQQDLLPDDVSAALLAALETAKPSAARLAKMKKSALARVARFPQHACCGNSRAAPEARAVSAPRSRVKGAAPTGLNPR